MSLRFERLEQRLLPAVTFDLNAGAGILTITGDAADDVIDIEGSSLNGFTVNGQPFGGYELIRVRSGEGNDTIIANNLQLGEDLEIITNGGNDTVTLANINVEDLDIRTGDGDDAVTVDTGYVRLLGDYLLGNGDNSLAITSIRADERTNIVGGNGLDDVSLVNTSLGRTTQVRLGASDNSLLVDHHFGEYLHYTGGNGIDSVTVQDTTLQEDLSLSTSGGNDDVFLLRINVEDLRANTGGGDDVFNLQASHVRKVTTVQTSSGDDTVIMNNNVFEDEPVSVNTDAGNDLVRITRNAFVDDLTVRTGSGSDGVTLVPDNFLYIGDVRIDGGSSLGDSLTTLIVHTSIRAESRGFEVQNIV